MNKIKGSIIAKIIAWVVLAASSVIFVCSCGMAYFLNEGDFFTRNYEETRQQKFEKIYDRYSALVLYNLQNDSSEKSQSYFEDKCFRYGVMKADSLEEMNLNDARVYEERNFTNQVKNEDLHRFHLELSDWIDFDIDNNGLLGSYYISYHGESKTLYADRICYDTEGGIFYYRAEGKYYPAQYVEITAQIGLQNGDTEERICTFYYDNDLKKYINEELGGYVVQNDGLLETTVEEIAEQNVADDKVAVTIHNYTPRDESTSAPVPIVMYDDKALEILNNQQALTFNEFDDTSFSYQMWGEICFDGVRYLDGSELNLINSDNIPQSQFATHVDSWLDDNFTLHVEKYGEGETYWVVSFIDEDVLAQEKQQYLKNLSNKDTASKLLAVLTDRETDLFVLEEILVDVAYELHNKIFGIIFGTFILALGCFIFLMCGAGHRRNKEELVLTFADKIPFDILCILAGGICLVAVFIIDAASYSDSVYVILNISVFMGITMLCTLLIFTLSFAVRVKAGKWWRNTVVYRICAGIKSMAGLLLRNIGLLWKIGLLLIVWLLAETFIMFGFFAGDESFGVVILCIEKLLIAVGFLLVIRQFQALQEGSKRLAEGNLSSEIDTSKMFWEFKQHGENLNRIGEGISRAVDERMKSERFKTELITNVSHDIKTPLTSIINYVDLLEKTRIQDETQKEYLEVLERQSARLKKLIEDLIEASKASTGNLPVNLERLEADVFLTQIAGEFEEKLEANRLELILGKPEETVYLNADGRHLWRVVDNLMNNICKYAQPDSRVYINLESKEEQVTITFRNISRYPLNISSDELMERFVRGDSSRNTEGNGLGLSIASSLMDLMNGKLTLYVDGDLFKAVLAFPQN